MASQIETKYAYSTLITRASYLPGIIILAYTLKKQASQYPLVVLYTTTLCEQARQALELEANRTNILLKPCDLLLPPEHNSIELVAERFADTWTKLRVFELFEYDVVCYLDADMMVLRNMDSVFTKVDLPADHIAACHDCVCNPDKNPWSPDAWRPVNCAYTLVSHPRALTQPIQPSECSMETLHALNSGTFLYRPSPNLMDGILDFFNTTDKLTSFKCPDQEFLAYFFRNRWIALPWQYNARKTMRYRHTNIWRDDEVVCLHYIVDKPWTARVNEDGSAGYKGQDGETHQWWWNEYIEWAKQREFDGAFEVLETVMQYVASGKDGECNNADMRAIGQNLWKVVPDMNAISRLDAKM